MKYLKRVFCGLLSLLLICGIFLPAFAADEPYTYTVRIFAGNQGTIAGSDVYVLNNLKYGSERYFNTDAVQVKDSNKYRAVGIREAGKDNSEIVQVITVDADRDYVVAYAVPGDTVKYVVHYVDEDGKEIVGYDAYGNIVNGHKEFYGIKNSEVVISPTYIEGYAPKEPFLRETLSDNEAENEFYYPYTTNTDNSGGNGGGNGGNGGDNNGDNQNTENQDQTPTAPTIPDLVLPEIILPTPAIPAVPTITPGDGSDNFGNDDEDANGGNGENEGDANADADAANAGENGEGNNEEEEEGAVDFFDIFDQESPLAGMKKAVEYITQPGSPLAGWSAPAAVTTSVLVLLGIPALIVFLILFFKKKKDDEKDKKAKAK